MMDGDDAPATIQAAPTAAASSRSGGFMTFGAASSTPAPGSALSFGAPGSGSAFGAPATSASGSGNGFSFGAPSSAPSFGGGSAAPSFAFSAGVFLRDFPMSSRLRVCLPVWHVLWSVLLGE